MKKLSVVLLTLVLAAAWTATAFAEVKPYASVRMMTFYKAFDNGASADTAELQWDLAPATTSRLGFKFKVSDEVSGLIELNVKGTGLRHAFGKYDFGAGTLTIGQTWNPYSVFFSNVYNDTAGANHGSAALRDPQVRLTLDMGLYVALIKSGLANATDDEIELPEIAIGYKGKAGNVGFGIHGAYVSVDDSSADEEGYAIMADISAKLGAVKLMGRALYGEDVKNIRGNRIMSTASSAGDLDTYALIGQATFYPSDKVAVTAGVGYQETEAASGDDNNELILWLNAPIKVTKGFTIVPEIAYIDALDVAGITDLTTNQANAEDALFIGAKWQFDL